MENLNLHPRHKKILSLLLNNNDWIKGSDIALELNVTDRTIRNDIAYINSLFKRSGDLITSFRSKGYILKDINKAKEILREKVCQIPDHPEERTNFILRNLLLQKDKMDVYEFADKLKVSESTIENDLRKIKELLCLNRRNLELSRKHSGISLIGSERDKRDLLSELLFNETNGNFFDLFKYEKYFKSTNLNFINESLIKIIKRYNVQLNEMAIINLVIHIAITIERIKNENVLDINLRIKELHETVEFKIAEEIVKILEKEYNIVFPSIEVFYISLLILGKRILINTYSKRSELEGIVEPFFLNMTEEIIGSIKRQFGIDFTKDENLYIGLCLHIKTMYFRIKNGIRIRNPLLEDLKRQYSFVFEITISMSKEFYKITGLTMNEDEIGFVALHLGVAFERLKDKHNTVKRVAVICPTGYTTSNFLVSKLNSIYKDDIEILGVYSFLEIDNIINIKPDIIITTVKLNYDIPIRTIKVSPFLSREDIETLNRSLGALNIYDEDKVFSKEVQHFFREDIFYKNLSMENEFEIINFLGKELSEKGYVPLSYINYVVEREKISSTSFGNLVAIPHPIVMNAYETVISTAMLEKPIIWGQHKVQLVFMFALKEGDRRLNDLYRHILEIVERTDGVNYLIKSEDFNNFISRILNYKL